MKTLRPEDLIKGQYYYTEEDRGEDTIFALFRYSREDSETSIMTSRFITNMDGEEVSKGKMTEFCICYGNERVCRAATQEEINWLLYCLGEKKYFSYETYKKVTGVKNTYEIY